MSGRIHWARGGEARVVSIDGDAITLSSSVPSPPGSRIGGTLETPPPTPIRIKIHASRLTGDGGFELRGRLLDATRDVRSRLEQEVRGGT